MLTQDVINKRFDLSCRSFGDHYGAFMSGFAAAILLDRVPRDMSAAWEDVSENLKDKGQCEHGSWLDDRMTVFDLYFLSQAQYFVGSQVFTYSFLIANLVAARSAVLGADEEHNPLRWVRPAGQSSPTWNVHVNEFVSLVRRCAIYTYSFACCQC